MTFTAQLAGSLTAHRDIFSFECGGYSDNLHDTRLARLMYPETALACHLYTGTSDYRKENPCYGVAVVGNWGRFGYKSLASAKRAVKRDGGYLCCRI